MHVGVDNLNVVTHVSGIIAGRRSSRPFPLVNDDDLLLLVQQMVKWRGSGNTCVTKVKGHADDGLVASGRVQEVDRNGKLMLLLILAGSGCIALFLMLGG